jgi:hypothetical protein
MNRAVTSYPASGWRMHTSGVFSNTGSAVDYWGCAISGANVQYLYFSSAAVSPVTTSYRACGFPVRCVQHLLLLKIESEHSVCSAEVVTIRKVKAVL